MLVLKLRCTHEYISNSDLNSIYITVYVYCSTDWFVDTSSKKKKNHFDISELQDDGSLDYAYYCWVWAPKNDQKHLKIQYSVGLLSTINSKILFYLWNNLWCNLGKPATCRTGQFCRNKQNDIKIKNNYNFELLRYKILHSPERFRRVDRRPQRLL